MNKVDLLSLATCNPFEAVTENVITIVGNNPPQYNTVPYYDYDTSVKIFVRLNDLNKEYCKTNKYNEMTLGLDDSIISILKKMYDKGRPLGSLTESKRGAEVSKKYLRENNSGIATLIGQDMKKYSIIWDNTYLPTSHKEYLRLLKHFNSESIYLRRVDSMLEATISPGKYYGYNKNVYGITRKEGCELEIHYLLACLNSKALDFYYKKRFSTKKTDVFPEIQTYLYEQLPIPPSSEETQKYIKELVDDILIIKQGNPNAETLSIEQKLDNLIFRLFDLSYDEILTIDPTLSISREEYNKIQK
jgi:hypothetical protein